jgi:MFS family permease
MSAVTDNLANAASASPWAPLKIPVFRMLWFATLASSIGAWMHEVAAGWLMTSLSPTPVMVALVQTATTLPIFLLAMPAGTLSDIVDRRRYLIAVQVDIQNLLVPGSEPQTAHYVAPGKPAQRST